MWERRFPFYSLTHFFTFFERIRMLKEWHYEFEFVGALHGRRMAGVLKRETNSHSAPFIAELKWTSYYKVRGHPRTLRHFQLLSACFSGTLGGVGSNLSSISRIPISCVHFDGVDSIYSKHSYAEHLYRELALLQFVPEVPPKVNKMGFQSLPAPICTIAKYAEIPLFVVIVLMFFAVALAVIQCTLPQSRGYMILVSILIGIGSLVMKFLFIWLACFFFRPSAFGFPARGDFFSGQSV
jgi:hypothetical protein